jgi:hypothetical protein
MKKWRDAEKIEAAMNIMNTSSEFKRGHHTSSKVSSDSTLSLRIQSCQNQEVERKLASKVGACKNDVARAGVLCRAHMSWIMAKRGKRRMRI